MPTKPDDLLTSTQAAAEAGVAMNTWFRWVREGIAPKPLVIGGKSRWRRRDCTPEALARQRA